MPPAVVVIVITVPPREHERLAAQLRERHLLLVLCALGISSFLEASSSSCLSLQVSHILFKAH